MDVRGCAARRHLRGWLAALVVASACDGPAPPPSDSAEAIASDSTPVPDTASAALAIEGEGLRIFLVSSGSARPLPFGTERDGVVRALTAVLASQPVEQGTNVECNLAYVVWPGGLTTWFANGAFAGWSLGEAASPDFTTPSGVGVGSTRAELESSYVAEVVQSSLGVEFTAGGLAGILASAEADARLTHLWAGQTCIAR